MLNLPSLTANEWWTYTQLQTHALSEIAWCLFLNSSFHYSPSAELTYYASSFKQVQNRIICKWLKWQIFWYILLQHKKIEFKEAIYTYACSELHLERFGSCCGMLWAWVFWETSLSDADVYSFWVLVAYAIQLVINYELSWNILLLPSIIT